METQIVAQISIGTSREEVFKYLTQLKYHFLWNPHLQNIAPLTTLKLGEKYKSTSLMLGVRVHGVNEVSKFTPNQELELHNGTGTLTYRVNYRLKLKGATTLLTCKTIVASKGKAFAFTKPLLTSLAKREIQSDLKALKIAVEQKLE